MHNKKAIKKFLAIILMSILMCSFFAVTTFAAEEVRYATSEDVNMVFGKYLNSMDFTQLSESDTVTKSELKNAIEDTTRRGSISKIDELPVRIILDLKSYPKDLITLDDLFMYLDEFEKNNIVTDNDSGYEIVQIKFADEAYEQILIILGLATLIVALNTLVFKPDYSKKLEKIEESIRSTPKK